MTSGWGVDATLSGSVVTSGTTSSDVRKVWGALYSKGIISGCKITRSGSSMTYTVSSGVVAISTSSGQVVMAPVQGVSVTAGDPPGSGSRVDVIFVTQEQPSSGDSDVAVRVLSFANSGAVVLPDWSQEIARYSVSAGQSSSSAATQVGDVIYSIPYGGTLGRVHYWQNKYDGPLSNTLKREGYGTFDLPTDRLVRFTYRAVISAQGAAGFDNSKYCEYGYIFNSDRLGGSGDFVIHTTPGLHQAWGTYEFNSTIILPAGKNTVSMAGVRTVGPGTVIQHYGTDVMGYGRNGAEFSVVDLGPANFTGIA